MIVIRDFTSTDSIPDPDLSRLIQQRAAALEEYELPLADLALFIIVQPGDTPAAIDAHLGFPILSNRWIGIRYGQPGFTPSWEVTEEHAHWYELVFVLSDDGFGVYVFVPKDSAINPKLLAMCSAYATHGA